jgi:hypothetical protein
LDRYWDEYVTNSGAANLISKNETYESNYTTVDGNRARMIIYGSYRFRACDVLTIRRAIGYAFSFEFMANTHPSIASPIIEKGISMIRGMINSVIFIDEE